MANGRVLKMGQTKMGCLFRDNPSLFNLIGYRLIPVNGSFTELLFNSEQLVVLGDPV
jgi:hypothetical protein